MEACGLSAKGLRSWTGLILASLYRLVFAALYANYLSRAGTWFADLPLVLAALPYTLLMRALSGGSYDFAGDMTVSVIVAALFCCALAYLVGYVVETALRTLARFISRALRAG
jgi:hypothetical protein